MQIYNNDTTSNRIICTRSTVILCIYMNIVYIYIFEIMQHLKGKFNTGGYSQTYAKDTNQPCVNSQNVDKIIVKN